MALKVSDMAKYETNIYGGVGGHIKHKYIDGSARDMVRLKIEGFWSGSGAEGNERERVYWGAIPAITKHFLIDPWDHTSSVEKWESRKQVLDCV